MLDKHGWAIVDELIEGVSKTHPLTWENLKEIVNIDEKQRCSFNEDHSLIRANQGHSIPVDVELEEVKPPKYLYHGTGEKYVSSIDQHGLIPKSRLYMPIFPALFTPRIQTTIISSDEKTFRQQIILKHILMSKDLLKDIKTCLLRSMKIK